MARVLVVEDDALVRHALRDLLKSEGHDVTAAASAHAALQATSAATPDIVLLDVGLPDIDGIECAMQLRARRIESAIVFLTAHGDASFVARAVRSDPYAYLVKPISGEQLVPIVQTALHAGERARAREGQLLSALSDSREISTAVGMLAERHGSSIDDAFSALRLIARSEGRRISEVAAEITSRSR